MNREEDLLFVSATELARAIRAREVSAVEVVGAYQERLAGLNPMLNSVLQIAAESAMEQARAADERLVRGETVGPLHGVPFTVKDVFDVSPKTARLIPAPGMVERPDPTPALRDSTAVRRLREAGAILIGITRATLWSDREERYGPAHNPYDLSRTTSGSSGGEAATIAAGGSPLGLGSDSGGSLRLPAHCCGVATLRPSNYRVPRATDADGTNDPRTAAGPLARSVDDLILAMNVLAGYDPTDPMTLPLPPLGDPARVVLKGLRVAFHTDNGIAPPTREVAAAVVASAWALEAAGAVVEERTPPDLAESWAVTHEYWRWCREEGNVADYVRFLARWDRYRVTLASFLEGYDLILCPVEAYPAPVIGANTPPMFTYTTPFSLVGWPAAVVRAGTSPEGLPLSVQSVAGPLHDDIALAAARIIESALGGWQPPRH
jgi:amidase